MGCQVFFFFGIEKRCQIKGVENKEGSPHRGPEGVGRKVKAGVSLHLGALKLPAQKTSFLQQLTGKSEEMVRSLIWVAKLGRNIGS
jgi:hypothetical protein